jgi:hypothetical protein
VRHGLAFLEYMGKNFATDLFLQAHHSPPTRSRADRPALCSGRRGVPSRPWYEPPGRVRRRSGGTLRPCQRAAGDR